ncbi:LysM peptidoglycan-binding domain-containing protein [Bacillus songklensis]|uniref:LysM peptidoglycan-binding domain-containing protein n=1 Tax=Bacillus songklensis TaxID=1069116 RepID=A0ABV8B8X0_9BACI
MKIAMSFENPNKIGITREEYKERIKELKSQKFESKIVKIIGVSTDWIKGRLRKVVLAVVILANGLFATQAFACNEYKVQAGDNWDKLSKRSGFTIEYLKQINGKETNVLKIGETVVLPDIEEHLTEVEDYETLNTDILIKKAINNQQKENEKRSQVDQDEKVHIVKNGDNLWRIARNHHTTVEKIMDDNHLTSTKLKPGQKMIIKQTETINSKPVGSKDSEQSSNENLSSYKETSYIVKNGDNLWKIARGHHTTVERLMTDNQLSSSNLKVGQKIAIRHQNVKTVTAKMTDIGDPTTAYFTREDGTELILQIPYGKEWEMQLLRGKKMKITYVEHHEGVGKLVHYS